MSEDEDWVIVDYRHEPTDTSNIELGIGTAGAAPNDWKPAYRDTVARKRVVRAQFPNAPRGSVVWVRDKDGIRRIRTLH